MNIELFKTESIYKKIYDIDENGREICVYKLDQCIPCGINLYYPNVLFKTQRCLILPLLEKTMSLQSGTIYEKHSMRFQWESTEIKTTYMDPLFFFIYNTDNYFHFLYDSVPYLISFLDLRKEVPNLKLLMQYPNKQKANFYPFVLEFLEILDINQDDIVIVNPHVQYASVYISTSYTHDIDSNLPPRKEIFTFYHQIVDFVKQKSKKYIDAPQKIYVSRRTWMHNDFSNIGTNYTTRRKCVNEDELVEKLIDKGYTEVFTEKLSTIEKILYFAHATHVIGAIGGGISNVLFSPRTTKLQALISPTFLDVNKRFKYSLDCVDVYYNNNTQHTENGEFKTYMRVKTKNETIIGEIEKIGTNVVLVSYLLDASNTGWNAQNTYEQIELYQKNIIKLDNGLNSPWIINLDSLS